MGNLNNSAVFSFLLSPFLVTQEADELTLKAASEKKFDVLDESIAKRSDAKKLEEKKGRISTRIEDLQEELLAM